MSNSCTGTDCSNKIAEYKNGIDKLLKRLRESENQRSEYEIQNLTLKQKLNRPSKSETKHFQRMFNLIQTLMDTYSGNCKKDESIRDVFLAMIDSIWSLLAVRYTDIDSWLDLKYLGTNLVETLTKYEQTQCLEETDDHIYETLSNLKKDGEFNESNAILEFSKENFIELNKELDSLRIETTKLSEKILEQNCVIKNLCKSFAKKLKIEKQQQQQILNTSSTSTTTVPSSSSGRLSSSSNEISSGSFNSSQNTNHNSSGNCLNEKHSTDTRGPVRIFPSQRDGSGAATMTCHTCRKLVDARRCPVEKFEKHILACKDTCTNVQLKEREINNQADQNTNTPQQRKWSGSSMASNSSSNSSSNNQASSQRRSSDSSNNSKNYMIIQSFEPKPRKRL